jgi:hypothetical protein
MASCEVTLKNGKTIIVDGRVELFDEENPKVRGPINLKGDAVHLFNSKEVVSVIEHGRLAKVFVDGMSAKEVQEALEDINQTTPR